MEDVRTRFRGDVVLPFSKLQEAARYHGCQLVTDQLVDDMMGLSARNAVLAQQLQRAQEDIGSLRRALKHQPWWRRLKAWRT